MRSTGRLDSWRTSSATLPNINRFSPRRECVAIAMASASTSRAVVTICLPACPWQTTVAASMPLLVSCVATRSR